MRSDIGSTSYELLFNLSGQKVSIWNAATGAVVEEDTRMGAAPIALYQGGNLYYEHQDWVGTERMLTNSSGAEAGTYASLPFGDGFTDAGTDLDPYHFAGLDHDYESGLDHAQYREYTGPGGRWLSPDPYDGSYDFSNPQSFNRYAYVMDNPLSFNDPLGLQNDDPPPTSGGDDCDICNDLTLGIADAIEALLGLDAPSFNGSLQPRPNDPDTIQVNAFGTELNPDVNPTALSLNGGLLVPNNPNNPKPCSAYSATGTATYYNLPGQKTAGGAPFNPNTMNAAMFQPGVVHMGDVMQVSLVNNPNAFVTVTINDTGPFLRGPNGRAVSPLQSDPNHLIDLTPAAFMKLNGSLTAGHAQVNVNRVCNGG